MAERRHQPYPCCWINGQVGAQCQPPSRRPERNAMPAIRNTQKPIKLTQIRSQARYIPYPKGFPAAFTNGASKDKSRSDPGGTGEADLRKSTGEQKAGNNRERVP